MIDLLTQPPPPEALDRLSAIDGVRFTQGVLATQTGPDGGLGPEAAGAILFLQATFADEERAAAFWQVVATLAAKLSAAPGFIRRYSFADGPHHTLVALWRRRVDAEAFFASDDHRAAMRDLYQYRWQYSHFAGLWERTAPRQRTIFCTACDGVTAAGQATCRGCGTELFDPYAGER